MRKTIVLQVLVLLVCMGACFLLGWRVMPRVWPDIKEHAVYTLLPSLRPTQDVGGSIAETAEAEPYVPQTNTVLGEEIGIGDSVIYYFYKPYCPYCVRLEPLLAGLPEQITLPDGTQSRVRVIAIDKTDAVGGALTARYYEDYETPDERQFVPAVLIGERYLLSEQEIVAALADALAAGEGRQTPLIDGAARVP